MEKDHNRADARRAAIDKEVVRTVSSLERILSNFRDGLNYRRSKRARQAQSLEKLTTLRKETVAALKSMVATIDRLKKEITRFKDEAARMQREETSLKGKYVELLSGRVPPDSEGIGGSFDTLFVPQDVNLAEKREKFMERLKGAFEELDTKLAAASGGKNSLLEKIEMNGRKIKAFERKKEILFQKLEIYKNEASRLDRELKLAAEEEETLLKEYDDFTSRVKAVLTVPPSVQKIIQRALQEMEMEKSGAHGL